MSEAVTISTVEERFDSAQGNLDLISMSPKLRKGADLQKYDPNILMVSHLRDLAQSIVIDGPSDVKGMEKAKKVMGAVRKVSGKLTSWKEESKSEALAYIKLVDGYHNSIKEINEQARTAVKSLIDQVRAEETRLKKEADEKLEERYRKRYEKLIQMGLTFNGILKRFEIQDAFIEEDIVRSAPKEILQEKLEEAVAPTLRRIKREASLEREQKERRHATNMQRADLLSSSDFGAEGVCEEGTDLLVKGTLRIPIGALYLYSKEKFEELCGQFAAEVVDEPIEEEPAEELATTNELSLELDETPQAPTEASMSDAAHDLGQVHDIVKTLRSIQKTEMRTATGRHAIGSDITPKITYLIDWFTGVIKDL